MTDTNEAIRTLLDAKKRIEQLETGLRDCVDADSEPYGGSVRSEAIYRARQLLEPHGEGWVWTATGWEFVGSPPSGEVNDGK